MKTLNKILIIGGVLGVFALGYSMKEYIDRKHDCIYNRTIQMANAEDTNVSQVNTIYSVSGKCYFDFSQLEENKK